MFYCADYHVTLILFCYTLLQYQENVTVRNVTVKFNIILNILSYEYFAI